jgi:hypothetical protein
MSFVSSLLDHIRLADDQADAAVGAFVDLFERTGLTEQERPYWARPPFSSNEWDEAVEAITAFLREDPDHPSLVVALGKSHDPRSRPVLEDLTMRFASEPGHEELAWQALVGLLNFDDVPERVLDHVDRAGSSERLRRLAHRRLELLSQLS